MATTTELILPNAVNNDAAVVKKHADKLMPLIPPGVDPQQFLACCVVAANEITKPCDPVSVLKAASNCARLGLMPGSALGLAYFVPFNDSRKQITECQLIVGYRGFIDLAFGSKFLAAVHSEVVLAGEEFEQWVDETGPRIKHQIPLDRDVSAKNVVGAYTVYQTVSGGRGVVVMSRKQIDSVMPKRDSDVWKYRYPEMAMKSSIRRAAKFWKLTPQLAMAVTLDEQAELGQSQLGQIPGGVKIEERRPLSLSDLPDDDEPTSGAGATGDGPDVYTIFAERIETCGSDEALQKIIADLAGAVSKKHLTRDDEKSLRETIAKKSEEFDPIPY